MEATIKKWGNSPALRLPATLMRAATLGLEQRVNITAERGRIIIEPIDSVVAYNLDDLLKGMTPANMHAEVSFGSPVGQESL